MTGEEPLTFVPHGNQRTKSAGRRVDANIAATARWFRDQEADSANRRAAEAREARAAEEPVCDSELAGATHVFDARRREWRVVVKVNAKTVSVASGYSWTDRVPKTRITAVQTVNSVHK